MVINYDNITNHEREDLFSPVLPAANELIIQ